MLSNDDVLVLPFEDDTTVLRDRPNMPRFDGFFFFVIIFSFFSLVTFPSGPWPLPRYGSHNGVYRTVHTCVNLYTFNHVVNVVSAHRETPAERGRFFLFKFDIKIILYNNDRRATVASRRTKCNMCVAYFFFVILPRMRWRFRISTATLAIDIPAVG